MLGILVQHSICITYALNQNPYSLLYLQKGAVILNMHCVVISICSLQIDENCLMSLFILTFAAMSTDSSLVSH